MERLQECCQLQLLILLMIFRNLSIEDIFSTTLKVQSDQSCYNTWDIL
jgi:hypothetical protein